MIVYDSYKKHIIGYIRPLGEWLLLTVIKSTSLVTFGPWVSDHCSTPSEYLSSYVMDIRMRLCLLGTVMSWTFGWDRICLVQLCHWHSDEIVSAWYSYVMDIRMRLCLLGTVMSWTFGWDCVCLVQLCHGHSDEIVSAWYSYVMDIRMRLCLLGTVMSWKFGWDCVCLVLDNSLVGFLKC
jgi:hypothetical protein